MNGSRAKSIRRHIYGDHSIKIQNRKYTLINRGVKVFRWFVDRSEKSIKLRMTQVVSVELRHRYQQAKQQWKLTHTMPTRSI